ncbi:MAG: hypothetical protein R3F65_02505 [bacterium]|nr:hypothetical protein [Myxococcales bacterium]
MTAAPRLVRAPGKLILLGEYAVLDGAPALVVAVDRHATCVIEPSAEVIVDAGEHGSLRWPGEGTTLPLVRALFAAHPPPPGRYVLRSDALHADTPDGIRKLGLGSSAATTVALAAAVLGEGIDPAAIYGAAQAAHRRVQGTGSGADVAASTRGGAMAYRWFNEPGHGIDAADGSAVIEALSSPFDAIHAIWSGDSASTPRLVAAVDAWAKRDPIAHRRCLEAIAAAAAAGIAAWKTADRPALTAAAAAGRDALAALGRAAGVALVTDTHQRLDALARPFGAVVKPTGAGGGDLAWLCAPDEAREDAAAAAIAAAGHRGWRFGISGRGAR